MCFLIYKKNLGHLNVSELIEAEVRYTIGYTLQNFGISLFFVAGSSYIAIL